MLNNFLKGIFKENPVFVLLLGLCPALAVTTSAANGFGMGMATLVVLLGSNIVVSLFKDFIPSRVRIPSYIVIIATFVTMVDMFMEAYFVELHNNLGLFIPLIVVNCTILGRAEAFASKEKVMPSIVDALGMGLGFTLSLTVLGFFRHFLGTGELFGVQLFEGALLFLQPAGAFLSLGLLLGIVNAVTMRRTSKQ
ncbi:electron transport complex subunit E [Proteinivorax tanatarense]|uniref:Ion-translocating oxidoreductase complex subunit E n=1 Tax=Proteinivorax tanatarense TaxID=1260629 RepID=A0AAU7VIG9_9FIRM